MSEGSTAVRNDRRIRPSLLRPTTVYAILMAFAAVFILFAAVYLLVRYGTLIEAQPFFFILLCLSLASAGLLIVLAVWSFALSLRFRRMAVDGERLSARNGR